MRTLLLGVVLVVAAPVWAQSPALREATRLLADGEFERALKTLDAAVKRSSAPAELAALHVERGKCLLALARRPQARAAFTAALSQDVGVEVGDDASPDAVALFSEARAAFPGRVTVTVEAEASVQVDGRDLGPAPLTVALPHGSHVIDVTAADGRRAQRAVQVQAGRELSVAVPLPPLPPRPPIVEAPVLSPPEAPAPAPVAAAATAGATSRSSSGWVVAGAGVAVAVGGGLCLWQAGVQYDRIADPSAPALTDDELRRAAATGRALQPLGWVGLGVGAAAIATGAVLLALPPSTPADPKPTVVGGLAPGGGGWVGVGGRLP